MPAQFIILNAVAGNKMTGRHLTQGAIGLTTDFLAFVAAGSEAALVRKVDGRGDFAAHYNAILGNIKLGDGNGGEQGLGVGVDRITEELLGRSLFYQLPQIHHGDVVCKVVDDGEVVGNEDVSQAKLFLQIL